jgi:hypothetical protein
MQLAVHVPLCFNITRHQGRGQSIEIFQNGKGRKVHGTAMCLLNFQKGGVLLLLRKKLKFPKGGVLLLFTKFLEFSKGGSIASFFKDFEKRSNFPVRGQVSLLVQV